MTHEQLQDFIKTRNDSMQNNNFQFEVDMAECGLSLDALGDPRRIFVGWAWDTEFGTLIENTRTGKLYLS